MSQKIQPPDELFDRFIAPFLPQIKKMALRYCFGNRHDAEDLVQEVSIKIIKAAEKYNPSLPLENFVISIARNRMIDFQRRGKNLSEKVERMVAEADNTPRYRELHHLEDFLENLLDVPDLKKKLGVIIDNAHLSLPEKRVLLAHIASVADGTKSPVVAKSLGMKHVTFRTALVRARKKAKQAAIFYYKRK